MTQTAWQRDRAKERAVGCGEGGSGVKRQRITDTMHQVLPEKEVSLVASASGISLPKTGTDSVTGPKWVKVILLEGETQLACNMHLTPLLAKQ